jgi:proteasome lid subunit RPN8/RPN11
MDLFQSYGARGNAAERAVTRATHIVDMASLHLAPTVRTSLETWSVSRYPAEACGLLLGTRTSSHADAHLAREARNLRTSNAGSHFELDPADHLAAELEAAALGLEIIGIWHSHPDAPPNPSRADRAAAWSAWSYVIVSVHAGAHSEMRSWRLTGAQFEEERLLS